MPSNDFPATFEWLALFLPIDGVWAAKNPLPGNSLLGSLHPVRVNTVPRPMFLRFPEPYNARRIPVPFPASVQLLDNKHSISLKTRQIEAVDKKRGRCVLSEWQEFPFLSVCGRRGAFPPDLQVGILPSTLSYSLPDCLNYHKTKDLSRARNCAAPRGFS